MPSQSVVVNTDGWKTMSLSDCIERVKVPSKIPKKQYLEEGTYPVISQEATQISGYWNNSEDVFSVDKPLVIFGDHTCNLKFVDFDFVVGADGVKILKPKEFLDGKFFFYQLLSFNVQSTGYARHFRKLKEYTITIPSLEEQQRIVSILDEAFGNISNTTEQVKRKMESSRSLLDSIFNSAFTGTITKKWRNDSPSNEPATTLMERILESRRAKSTGKYSEPITPQKEFCHDIPEEWTFATIEQLLRINSGLSYGILKPGDSDPNGVPMVRVLDIGDGKLSGTEIFMVSEKLANEYKRTRLEEGDIMLAVMATIGRCAIVPPHLSGGNVNRALAVLKLTKEIKPLFILYSLLSPQIQTLFQSKKQGTAQARINLKDLRKYCVPIPPLAEQEIIIQLLSDVVDEHELLEQNFRNQLKSLSQLKQSILQEAFNGTL